MSSPQPLLARCLLLVAACALLAAADDRLLGWHPADNDPLSKVGSDLRPYLGSAPAAVDGRLRARSLAASRPDAVKLGLDVAVTEANLAAIAATGATILDSSPRWRQVTVEATLAQAAALARIAAVDGVDLLRRPRHRAGPGIGSYDNEADSIIRTDTLRSTYGVDGTGMRIGVMSDSIHSTEAGTVHNGVLTGLSSQLSGDLPAAIPVVAFETSAGTDEGAGMMEEVHHLAPGAVCVFASCGDSPTAMAKNIGKLASLGQCTVACDDIGFFDEPMFQDGPIAQAADAFVAGGGIYLSAAGNSGTSGIIQTFADVNPGASDPLTGSGPDGSDFHDWGHGTSNGMLPLVIPDGGDLLVVMQWNQPYRKYALGAGAQTDLDLLLYAGPTASSAILAGSGDVQGTVGNPMGNPLEILEYINNTGSSRTVYLAIDFYRGIASGVVMRLSLDLSGVGSPLTSTAAGIFNCGTAYGHPVAANVLGIGAVDAATPTALEYFSSAGGWGSGASFAALPFYFDTTGGALVTTRNKPDLIAPDGVRTNWSNPFYGTSSAAPHAAAAAALVWSVRPSLTNTEVMDLLRNTATDLTIAPASAGDEAFAGHGLIDAFAASGTAVTRVTTASSAGVHTGGSITLSVGFSNPVTVTGTPELILNTTPARTAVYTGGSGTGTLSFTYTITAGDVSALLDATTTVGAIDLVGGATITDAGSGDPADLTLPALGSTRSLSGSTAIAIEAISPSLVITPTPGSSHAVSAFDFAFTFSHAVVGFNGGMITWTNATVGALTTGDNITFHATATAIAHGAVIATVAPGVVVDGDGYANLGATGQATYASADSGGSSGGGGGCSAGGAGILLLGQLLILCVRRRR